MIAAVAALVAFSADEFFPLTVGTKWTYQDENGVESVDEIGEELAITEKVKGIPVTTLTGGRSDGAVFYTVAADTLFLVGYGRDAKDVKATLLSQPQPIFRIGNPRADWKFVGEMQTELGPVLVQTTGSAVRGAKRQVLGKEVEILSTHLHSRIGNDNRPVEIDQDSVYGKGIGLVEMKSATKADGQVVKRLLKLVKFEQRKG